MHIGVTPSRNVSGDGIELSNSSSVGSSASLSQTPRTEGEILQSSNLKIFSFSDLKAATRNFRPDSILGEGGFGSVFKGWIDKNSYAASKPGAGMMIAVKRLRQDGGQGHKEWLVCASSFFNFLVISHVYRLLCFVQYVHVLIQYCTGIDSTMYEIIASFLL